jgi:hypothetical protein
MSMEEVIWKASRSFDNGTLAAAFDREIQNEHIAWYVDYYTEDPANFGVKYLVPGLHMTNENKEHRDSADKEGTQWDGPDVCEWFESKSDPGARHTWVFLLKTADDAAVYGIHCAAEHVFAFGPQSLSLPSTNLWEEYIEHGIRGPLKAILPVKDMKLVAIIENPRWGTLTQFGLSQEWMLTRAALLDG